MPTPNSNTLRITEYVKTTHHRIQAVQLTEENASQVSVWCSGTLVTDEEDIPLYIDIPNHLSERAHFGDYVTYDPVADHVHVLTNGTFRRSFIPLSGEHIVSNFDQWDTAPYGDYVSAKGNIFEHREEPTLFDQLLIDDDTYYPFSPVCRGYKSEYVRRA